MTRTPASGRSESALECHALTKDYGGGNGLFDLELRVDRGEIFGLIGPNGSGKSTMIKLIMDLIRADSGTAGIFGLDARRNSVAVKRRVGYVPGELPRFPGVSARYVVSLLAALRGSVDEGYVEELAAVLKLDLDQKFEELSHGNKQKVAIIQAFMHQPDLYVLDEPTLGLDPLIQREFRRLLLEANENGATILLSSHVLSEVEQICTRIGLLKRGRMWKVGTLGEFRELRTHRVEVVLAGAVDAAALGRIPNVRNVETRGNRVTMEVQGSIDPLLDALAPHDVLELDSRELSLEEVFFAEF